MERTLVSFDTDKIKGYVFETDKLKEIRGASSVLDRLNRQDMKNIAKKLGLKYRRIYANGGSGLFLVDADETTAEKFALSVKSAYTKQTHGGSSITYVIQPIPLAAPDEEDEVMEYPLRDTLNLLRYKMRESKDCAPAQIVLPSHPFMRTCEACGVNYAERPVKDPEGTPHYCCTSCFAKQKEDGEIKKRILSTITNYEKNSKKIPSEEDAMAETLWERIIYQLKTDGYTFSVDGYAFSEEKVPERPDDFNVFREFGKSKEYLGLIYADGNNMGAAIENLETLNEIEEFSLTIDRAIHQAMGATITRHLHVVPGNPPLFPFDVLLLGGDDFMIVTSAAKAMEVALTLAQTFRASAQVNKKHYSLSVGVVLAPVKYPFSQLQELVEQTLKAAKKGSAQVRADAKKYGVKEYDDTRISFLVVAGGTVQSYHQTLKELEKESDPQKKEDLEFHATLRPYDPQTLETLLKAIAVANKAGINRSKLHQMREAIFRMNLTTSVSESLAVLRNWQTKQRELVTSSLYEIGMEKQVARQTEQNLFSDFPRVTFPWFQDGQNDNNHDIYRTSLLDFIELYDFVAGEE